MDFCKNWRDFSGPMPLLLLPLFQIMCLLIWACRHGALCLAFLKRETKLWAKWLRKPRYGSWLFQQTHMWRCHSGKWRWKAWEKWDSKTQMIDGMPVLLGAICWRVQGNKWTQYNFEIACYFYETNQCNRTYKVQVYLPSPDSSPFLCL